jgi:hypothetical protein
VAQKGVVLASGGGLSDEPRVSSYPYEKTRETGYFGFPLFRPAHSGQNTYTKETKKPHLHYLLCIQQASWRRTKKRKKRNNPGGGSMRRRRRASPAQAAQGYRDQDERHLCRSCKEQRGGCIERLNHPGWWDCPLCLEAQGQMRLDELAEASEPR